MLDNYRGISLFSIPCKIFSLLIQKQLSAWVDDQLLEQQCGFRSGRSCNDAIFSMRLLHEHAVRKKAPIFTAFIDLAKAYDSVDRGLAWSCFLQRCIPNKLLRVIQLLHSGTQCAVVGDHATEEGWFEVGTGFKQGDVNARTFSMLFNLFLDTVLRDMQLELEPLGMSFLYRVDGTLREMPSRNLPDSFWSVLVANDMALVAASEADMQKALEIADQIFSRWGLELSLTSTKVMVVGGDVRPTCFAIARGQIEVVSDFSYLGSNLAADGGIGMEISQRVKAAAFAFHRLKAFWKDKHVKEHVKLKVYKAVVQATLLYACETWAATSSTVKALDVFQMQCLKRLFGISKIQHVENVEILQRASMDAVHDMVRFRRLRWLGHISRPPDTRLPKRILFSRIEQRQGQANEVLD